MELTETPLEKLRRLQGEQDRRSAPDSMGDGAAVPAPSPDAALAKLRALQSATPPATVDLASSMERQDGALDAPADLTSAVRPADFASFERGEVTGDEYLGEVSARGVDADDPVLGAAYEMIARAPTPEARATAEANYLRLKQGAQAGGVGERLMQRLDPASGRPVDEDAGTLQSLGRSVFAGVLSADEAMRELVGQGLDAVGLDVAGQFFQRQADRRRQQVQEIPISRGEVTNRMLRETEGARYDGQQTNYSQYAGSGFTPPGDEPQRHRAMQPDGTYDFQKGVETTSGGLDAQVAGYVEAFKRDPTGTLSGVANAAAQSAPDMAAGLAATWVNPYLGAAYYGASGAGRQLGDAAHDETGARREVGAREGAAAVLSGIGQAGFEVVADKLLIGRLGDSMRAAGLDEAAQRTVAREIAEGGSRVLGTAIKQGATEAPTEGVQTVIENVGAKYGWDAGRDVTEGVVESMLVGLAMGGASGGGGALGAEVTRARATPEAATSPQPLPSVEDPAPTGPAPAAELQSEAETEIETPPVAEAGIETELDAETFAAIAADYEARTGRALPNTAETRAAIAGSTGPDPSPLDDVDAPAPPDPQRDQLPDGLVPGPDASGTVDAVGALPDAPPDGGDAGVEPRRAEGAPQGAAPALPDADAAAGDELAAPAAAPVQAPAPLPPARANGRRSPKAVAGYLADNRDAVVAAADAEIAAATASLPPDASPADIERATTGAALASSNPAVLVQAWREAQRREGGALDPSASQDAAIADYLPALDVEHLADVAPEDSVARRAYFRRGQRSATREGATVRVHTPAEAAAAVAAESGLRVTTADVVDFVRRYPSGPASYRADVRRPRRAVEARFRDVAGVPLTTKRVAEYEAALFPEGPSLPAPESVTQNEAGEYVDESGNLAAPFEPQATYELDAPALRSGAFRDGEEGDAAPLARAALADLSPRDRSREQTSLDFEPPSTTQTDDRPRERQPDASPGRRERPGRREQGDLFGRRRQLDAFEYPTTDDGPADRGVRGRGPAALRPDRGAAVDEPVRQPGGDRDVAPDAASFADAFGPARLLGRDISDNLRREGGASLVGAVVEGPADLAALAQVLRDARIETLRYLFVKTGEDGARRIVHHTAVSSRLPGLALAFPPDVARAADDASREEYGRGYDVERPARRAEAEREAHRVRAAWIEAEMERAGADGFYLLHNHPTGRVLPSDADHDLTAGIRESTRGYLGHVIIDSGRYATVDEGRTHTERELDAAGLARAGITVDGDGAQTDPLLLPSLPNDQLGTTVKTPEAIAEVAKALQVSDGQAVLIGVGNDGRVRGLAEIPAAWLTRANRSAEGVEQARRVVASFARHTGSGIVHLGGIAEPVAPRHQGPTAQAARRLLRAHVVGDVLGRDGSVLRALSETGYDVGGHLASAGSFGLSVAGESVAFSEPASAYDTSNYDTSTDTAPAEGAPAEDAPLNLDALRAAVASARSRQPDAQNTSPDAASSTPRTRETPQPPTPQTVAAALTKAEIARVRDGLGLASLPPAERQTWTAALADVVETGLIHEAPAIAARVLRDAGTRRASPLSVREHVAFVARLATAQRQYREASDAVLALEREGKPTGGMQRRAEAALDLVDTLTRASDVAGSEVARALAVRRLQVQDEGGSFAVASVLRDARVAKGAALTGDERTRLAELADAAVRAARKVEQAEDARDRKRRQRDRERADRAVGREAERSMDADDAATSSAARARREAEILAVREERAEIKADLARLGLRLNDVVGLTAEGSVLVGRLALTYAREGALRFADVVARVREDLPDLTEDDVARAVLAATEAEAKAPEADAREADSGLVKLRTERDRARRSVRAAQAELRPATTKDRVASLASLPRSVLATGDMSAVGNQAAPLIRRHPVIAGKTFVRAFTSFFRHADAERIDTVIRSDDRQPVREMAGLYLAPLDADAASFTEREEAFASQDAKKAPWLVRALTGAAVGTVTMGPGVGTAVGAAGGLATKAVMRASEDHMISFLNLLRASVFDTFADAHPGASKDELQHYARLVNLATGRGELSDGLARIGGWALFSARLTAARFQAPYMIVKPGVPKRVRAEAAKTFAAFVGFNALALALLDWAGDDELDVGWDPRSSDFGKVRWRSTRIDLWGGYGQQARLFLRVLLSGLDARGVTEAPDHKREIDPLEEVARMADAKKAPWIGLLQSVITRKNFMGEPLTEAEAVAQSLTPLGVQAAQEGNRVGQTPAEGLQEGAAGAALNFFGLNASAYDDPSQRQTVVPFTERAEYRLVARPPDGLIDADATPFEEAKARTAYRDDVRARFASKVEAEAPALRRIAEPEALKERLRELASDANEEAAGVALDDPLRQGAVLELLRRADYSPSMRAPKGADEATKEALADTFRVRLAERIGADETALAAEPDPEALRRRLSDHAEIARAEASRRPARALTRPAPARRLRRASLPAVRDAGGQARRLRAPLPLAARPAHRGRPHGAVAHGAGDREGPPPLARRRGAAAGPHRYRLLNRDHEPMPHDDPPRPRPAPERAAPARPRLLGARRVPDGARRATSSPTSWWRTAPRAPVADALVACAFHGDSLVACAFHVVDFHLGRSDVTALLRQRLRSEHPGEPAVRARILVEHGAVVRVRRRYLVASPDPTTLAIAALITPSN